MATRRQCREWTLQLLFQLDVNPSEDLSGVFPTFWLEKGKKADARARKFTEDLVSGVRGNLRDLDATIKGLAEHWDIGRMGIVDRNVLRMALFEMQHCADIPAAVSINEAVDIAKYFSSTESGKFVNGILDRARKNMNKPAR
jgi:transcription antitermination protein NusB